MTTTVNGTERHAAVAAWQAAADSGEILTGAQLGERFGKSPRWGRDRIAEARETDKSTSRFAAADERQESGEAQDTDRLTVDMQYRRTAEMHAPADEPLPRQAARRPWYDTAIVLVVALVAAAASYGHMYEVALWAGEPSWLARAFPITVDGLVLAGLRKGEAGRWWLLLGFAASVAANVVSHFPETAAQAGPVVSAWPALALYGTHRLLHR